MSFHRNLAWNYFGQAYAVAVGLVMVPVYLRYLGVESYGLVGFFAMLQAWGQAFDLGLTPTLSRELSRVQAGTADVRSVATMVRATEWLFGLLGIAVGGAVMVAAGWISAEWLKPQALSAGEMRRAVMLMGGMIALRWLMALYRGGIAGIERMAILNIVGTAFATVRSIGVLAVLVFWTTQPTAFFGYQLIVSALELVATLAVFYRAFPMNYAPVLPRFGPLRALFPVAGSMAFLTGLWIVINQTDKFVLSGAVALDHYGFYSVAVSFAAGITLLATPLAQVLQPRFTILIAQGEHDRIRRLYRASLQAAAAVGFAIAGVMAFFAVPLLRAWTGSTDVAREAGRVLPMYAMGNAISSILTLAFVLQFAHGKLRWHLIGNILFAMGWFPGVIWAANRQGAVGVGWVWLIANAGYLLFWLPLVHRWLVPGMAGCLLADVLVIGLVEAVALVVMWSILPGGSGRAAALAYFVVATAVIAAIGLVAGGETRRAVRGAFASLLATKRA